MIRVIDHANRLRYRENSLDRQFRFRHEIFVRERGWTDFDKDGEYEVDQYDNEKTVYHVALDDNEKVIGWNRPSYPTLDPHMTSEVLPQSRRWAASPAPRMRWRCTPTPVARDRRHGNIDLVTSW